MKKILALTFLLVGMMSFSNNNITTKIVRGCEVVKLKAQNHNMDGTRFKCVANGVTYKFRESMINFKDLKVGSRYDIQFTGREVEVDEKNTTEISNLYLLDARLSR